MQCYAIRESLGLAYLQDWAANLNEGYHASPDVQCARSVSFIPAFIIWNSHGLFPRDDRSVNKGQSPQNKGACISASPDLHF